MRVHLTMPALPCYGIESARGRSLGIECLSSSTHWDLVLCEVMAIQALSRLPILAYKRVNCWSRPLRKPTP